MFVGLDRMAPYSIFIDVNDNDINLFPYVD